MKNQRLESYVNTTTGRAFVRCPKCGRPVEICTEGAPFDPMDTDWNCGRCPQNREGGETLD